MALLIDIKNPEWLRDEDLREQLLCYYTDADIRVAADPGAPEEIEMLALSSYVPGEALQYPNLKLIQKTGAGVNNILADDQLPESIQVARLPAVTSGHEIAEYALAFVLQRQRHLREYQAQQADSAWLAYPPRRSGETRVAILGLGRIGEVVAQRFVDNRFEVLGWSRRIKNLPGVKCFDGEDGLGNLLGIADYVVCVLPSTPATLRFFNYSLLRKFRPEAMLINVGRGDLVNEAELIRALDEGLLDSAVLDVVSEEPLPADNPLWLHEKIQLTPHVSGYHLGDDVADIVENYRRLKSGDALLHLVDRKRGY